MGEVVGAGLLAHVPTIMLPRGDAARAQRGQGDLARPRPAAAAPEVFEHARLRHRRRPRLALGDHGRVRRHRAGPPRRACSPPRSCRAGCAGSPTTGRATPSSRTPSRRRADEHGTWITAIDDPYLPIFYATVNLWHYLGRGLPDKRWIIDRRLPDRRHRGLPARSAGRSATRSRPPTAGSLLIAVRRAVAHVLAAAGAARPRGAATRRTSSPRRPATPTSSASPGSRRATTRGCSRRCRSSCAYRPEAQVLPLPDDDRRARRATAARRRAGSTASTRTRSAPARSTSGSTARPPAGPPAPACTLT